MSYLIILLSYVFYLARNWGFSLYGYKFDKYESWTCPSMSLNAKHDDMWTYMVFYSEKWKYWNLEWPLSRIWDFSLYGYKFDKYEGWTCPSMSLNAKHEIWSYLVLNSEKLK